MKSLTKKIIFAAVALFMGAAGATAEVGREHRSIWMTPYLSNQWPTKALTSSTASSQKSILTSRLDKFKDQNINVIYYHARVMCDALYESSYEPWSSTVSGTRGTAPYFDPFKFLIDEAHARGIEVYAWINPYRYSNSSYYGYKWGNHPLNYEVSHPDWLIMGNESRTLNPGLEVVKQRIVDVCKEIITKYDVDGLVMDDYFYPDGGTDVSVDADLYAAYTAAGGELTQTQWRAENVNEMVRRLMEMIKTTKPHINFGASPAGVASPSHTQEKYGLTPLSGDWQYSTIHSDPLAWLQEGTVDFISPQIYWPDKFNSVADWWSDASYKFGRHFFPSVSLSSVSTYGAQSFVDQTLHTRDINRTDEGGIVFFSYSNYVTYSEKYNGSSTAQVFANIMKQGAYTTKALTPIRSWRNKRTPSLVSNVTLSGTKLTWTAVPGMRYTVYAMPARVSDSQFTCQRQYLEGITYTNSYTIPSDKSSYRWAVCVYDRYGNEYSPMFAGATQKTISAATLTAPANGSETTAIFDFKWNGQGCRYVVELAEDAAFTSIVGTYEITTASLSSLVLRPSLESNKTYYWRVISYAANAKDTTSPVYSFVATYMPLVTPANGSVDVSLTPLISWKEAAAGAKYTLEISTREDFLTKFYTVNTTTASHQIPANTLTGYTNYYVRVTAEKDGIVIVGDVNTFRTKEVTDFSLPVFVTPSKNGMTIFGDQGLEVKPWTGLKRICIEASTSSSFPARSKITYYLENYATTTALLSSGSAGGWAGGTFTNGKTYYLRARGEYVTSEGTKFTDYTTVLTFVYDGVGGIDDVETAKRDIYVTPSGILMLAGDLAQVEIYSVSGQLVCATTVAATSYDLSGLAPGAYVIRVNDGQSVETLKYVK